jgi:hypothetical protein
VKNTVTKIFSATVAIVLAVVFSLGMVLGDSSTPAKADDIKDPAATVTIIEPPGGLIKCVTINNNQKFIRVVCKAAVITVLNQLIPVPTVPPITIPTTLPPITELIPGETVTVPGPTKTKTVQGPTKTKTITTPTQTVTENSTVTADPTGQPGGNSGTIGEVDPGGTVDFGDNDVTIQEVGIGILATIVFVALLLLTLWMGYVLGYKDADRENARFMDALLDLTRRGKHS